MRRPTERTRRVRKPMRTLAMATVLSLGAITATAGVASADDNFKQYCGGVYGNLFTCISYDYTNGYLATNSYNGNSNGLGYATVMIRIRHNGTYYKATNSVDVMPGHTWLGEPYYWGRPPGADQVCGFLTTNGAIVGQECANFY